MMSELSPVAFARFEKAVTADSLNELVREMTAEGKSQVEIYHFFDLFRDFLRHTGREEDEDRVMDTIDYIVGPCGFGARLFPHYLTNEEIEAYRRTLEGSADEQHSQNNIGNGN